VKIVRFMHDEEIQYGIVEDETVYICKGDLFDGLVKTSKAVSASSVRLLAPVDPPNIICLGLNYKKHADETTLEYPTPPLFLKTTTAVCGPNDPIVLPDGYEDSVDWEAELVIVIRKRVKNITEEQVAGAVLGYTIGNDVSNRKVQFGDIQWCRGKSHDTFCPLGPVIETELDTTDLKIECRLDGVVMQSSSTSHMIIPCAQIVSYLSKSMTLLPGTVIMSGTPEGVGYTRTPPIFMKSGQTVECTIEGIGTLTNPIQGRTE
jgi:2-keto-4-pentenoate hydratase/2-oxohepta-3-ene-1,7-dioic acid hydratase in catechol pathway